MDIPFYPSALARQFPRLDLTGFRALGEGGGCQVFETDNGLVWRFLKPSSPQAGLDLEIRLLPELAGAVSLPIPRYEYISESTVSPRFVGYRKIEGVPFTRERLAACCSDRPLRQLAQFLAELHRFSIERAQAQRVPLELPGERRSQWTEWSEQIHRHVFPLLDERQRAWAERTLSDWLDDGAMADYAPVLYHGDLWAEHILLDPEREELTGVIDFESASIGDPAGDWTALWLDHGDEAIARLLAGYQGQANETLRHRMLRLANNVPLNEILCGVLYDDRASWRAGWERMSQIVNQSCHWIEP
jgi:aminoglycoside 2''-phosphotransferase